MYTDMFYQCMPPLRYYTEIAQYISDAIYCTCFLTCMMATPTDLIYIIIYAQYDITKYEGMYTSYKVVLLTL